MTNNQNARGLLRACALVLAGLASACVDATEPLTTDSELGLATPAPAVQDAITAALHDAENRLALGISPADANDLIPALRAAADALAASDGDGAGRALDRAEHSLGSANKNLPDPERDAIRLAIQVARSGLRPGKREL